MHKERRSVCGFAKPVPGLRKSWMDCRRLASSVEVFLRASAPHMLALGWLLPRNAAGVPEEHTTRC